MPPELASMLRVRTYAVSTVETPELNLTTALRIGITDIRVPVDCPPCLVYNAHVFRPTRRGKATYDCDTSWLSHPVTQSTLDLSSLPLQITPHKVLSLHSPTTTITMMNLTLPHSRLAHSSTASIHTSSSASSSSVRLSVPFGLRRSYDSESANKSSDSFQYSEINPSRIYAEDMDDDNIAWGPVSHKKRRS
ncbi:uncharacterized protein FOMMEDRAFT_155736 [Fomitiporia mediterranea MF3/22]|uniref:uncharacterized protein n=1 Tax=Fomitiporia mediterranea (strain MF3/22) TaxID=694068 RepID=UPI0004408C0D|nr:uncharacterized protein FOMMEDRAFT_155736 [Fomitiporia mediterranea MF3/22]EJD04582.1 hypothetical protein FOMMEDRAFT_155736 [Fomitiporia mediterranea MF3/22]